MFQQLLDARIKDLWNFYLATGELSHQGEKGILREAFLRRLLETLLPPHFGVGSGLIVDRWNRQSSQTDLLVYDKRRLPPLLEQNGHGIYPIDAVLRVLEVKSTLDKDDLFQLKKAAWLLNPKNPEGLKIAAKGNLPEGMVSYPLIGLYAYNTRLADVTKTAVEVDALSGGEGICCVATRGVYLGSVFHLIGQADLESENLIHNTRLFFTVFLQALEATAASRKEFSLIEWLLPYYTEQA